MWYQWPNATSGKGPTSPAAREEISLTLPALKLQEKARVVSDFSSTRKDLFRGAVAGPRKRKKYRSYRKREVSPKKGSGHNVQAVGGVASKKNLLNVYLSEDVGLVYVCVAKENKPGVRIQAEGWKAGRSVAFSNQIRQWNLLYKSVSTRRKSTRSSSES